MKKIEGYMCDGCGTIYTDEKTANNCEKEHIDFTQLKITDAWFNKRFDYIPGTDNELKKNVFAPCEIRVRYKEKEKTSPPFSNSFVAFYKLTRLEYKEDDRKN